MVSLSLQFHMKTSKPTFLGNFFLVRIFISRGGRYWGDEAEEQGTEECGAMLTLDSLLKPPRIFFSKK